MSSGLLQPLCLGLNVLTEIRAWMSNFRHKYTSMSMAMSGYGCVITSHQLTHWGPNTICASITYAINGSDNGLSSVQHQIIIWTNAWILLIGCLGKHFSDTFIQIEAFSFKKMYLKVQSAILSQPQCVIEDVCKHFSMLCGDGYVSSVACWLLRYCPTYHLFIICISTKQHIPIHNM